MTAGVPCRHCADWLPAATDRYCGGCGAFVAPLTLNWRVEDGDASVRRIALAAELPSDWSADDRDDLANLAVTIQTPAGRRRDEGLTVGGLVKAGTTPLIDVERDVRGGVATTFLVHVAGSTDEEASRDGELLAALTLSEAPPVLSLPTADAALVEVTGRAVFAVRVRNWGGDFVATRARLRFGVDAPHETVLQRPTLLRGEAESLVQITLDEVDRQRALASDGVLEAELELLDGEDVHVVGRLQLASPAHPEASLTVPREIQAMAGAYGRIALRLRNVGGETLTFGGGAVLVTTAGGETRHEWSLTDLWTGPHTLTRDEATDVEIRPWMTDDGAPTGVPLGTGRHDVQVRIRLAAAGGDHLEAVAQGRLVVRKPEPFSGRVCIDFGTTESAAAVQFGLTADVDEGDALEPPTIIELGRVGVREGPDGGGERFLPTVAYEHDGEMFHGVEALRRHAADDDPGPLIRRFKWRLGETEGKQAAADYLTHVRELIERHPRVAALITPETPVVATRPTDFADGQNEALIRAFMAAGFGDPRREGFTDDGPPTLVYESWSPTVAVLWGNETDLMRRLSPGLEQQTVTPFGIRHDLEHPVLVVVYDVGGGSADLSVLRVAPSAEEAGLLLVSEVFKRTDLDFVGVRFEEVIRSALYAHVQNLGKSPDLSPGADAAWQEAVKAIQHAPGLFSGGAGDLARDQLAGMLKGGMPSLGLAEALAQRWGLSAEGQTKTLSSAVMEELRGLGAHLPKLRLPADDGAVVEVALAELPALLERVLTAFAARYVEPMRALADELVDASGLAQAKIEHTRLIPSGRGGAFPLAESLILALFEGRLGPRIRLGPAAGKSVTSYGALHLADMAELDAEIRFDLGRDRREFAVILGRQTLSAAKGRRRQPMPDVGEAAALRLSDLPARKLKKALEVDAAWPRSSNRDPVASLELTEAAVAAPEEHWLVAWREAERDLAVVVRADRAEDAVIRAKEQAK